MTYRHFEPKRGPNIFNGIHLNYSWKNFEFLAAVFNSLTIRETVNGYSVEDSYGIYPFGRSPFGTSSEFNGNVSSLGIIVLGLKQKPKKLTTQLWNYTAENVFNLALTQAEFQDSIRGHHLNFGIQGFFQNALDHGGNPDVLKAYILPEEKTFGLGAKLDFGFGKHTVSISNLYISDRGRFLFPREWGREIFFATLPRERFEGNGGVNAFSVKYQLKLPAHQWMLNFGTSVVNLPDVNNTVLNKYGMPSYYHFSFGIDHGL